MTETSPNTSSQMRLALVTPVYKDWDSFVHLMGVLDSVFEGISVQCDLFAVDDNSGDLYFGIEEAALAVRNLHRVEVIELFTNLGHQRAIATGLVEIYARNCYDAVMVMDADGEDLPEYVPHILNNFDKHAPSVVVARRSQRSEGLMFKAYYWSYQVLYRVLVGYNIDFGNFCLIPEKLLGSLVYNPNLWNHLASALIGSRFSLKRVDVPRGRRYAGNSSMNVESLIMHGLSAISVHTDRVFVRGLILNLALALLVIAGIILVVWIRVATDLAIPGWATTAVGLLAVVLFQLLMLVGGAVFGALRTRSIRATVPAIDAPFYIKLRKVLFAS